MKTLEEYLDFSYQMNIIEDKTEGGFVVSFPDLPGCITCGETIEVAVKNAQDAKTEWIKTAYNDGIKIAEPSQETEYSGQFKLRIPKSLHKTLAENSKKEGISMNQYCLYLLSESVNSKSRFL